MNLIGRALLYPVALLILSVLWVLAIHVAIVRSIINERVSKWEI